jgi:glucose/arabinose dehydrogenase
MTRRTFSLAHPFVLLLIVTSTLSAQTVPSGFTSANIATGLASPTAMTFAPDGRLFVCEKAGAVRVIKNDTLLARPFLSVTVNHDGERGLLGIACDPDFATNQFVYIYHTVPAPLHNRISRYTATGDTALAGSDSVILDLDNLSASNHNGGAIHFGPDGKLYAAVGENAMGSNSQSFSNLLGKILRINPNGTFPADNPFLMSTSGKNQAIWAMGLRNPYTFAFQPGTSRMFINDVGSSTWEEINDGIAGANYGWPSDEGIEPVTSFKNPMYAYASNVNPECAITGGTFYNPPLAQFGSSYTGNYFFSDYCAGWIHLFHPSDSSVTPFGSGFGAPVDLQVSESGSLYVADINGGRVVRVRAQNPNDVSTNSGFPAAFRLEQNYPNPFNPATIIRYTLPERVFASIIVYNAIGQQVALLVNQEQDAGPHEVAFEPNTLASGIYFYRLIAGRQAETRRLLFLR